MARSGGESFAALSFELVLIWGQLAVAILSGMGSIFAPGSDGALAQLVAVMSVQILLALYGALVRPSADRVMNLLIATQFALEAMGSAFLLVQLLRPGQPLFGSAHRDSLAAFLASVLALLAPVVQRFYDAVIVQLSKVMRQDGFSWKGFFFSMLGFVVFLPGMLIKLTSCNCSSSIALSATQGGGDDINKLATKMANEGLVKSIEEGIAELASRAFWQAHVEAEFRREATEECVEAAALLLQARWRARRAARGRLGKLRAAQRVATKPQPPQSAAAVASPPRRVTSKASSKLRQVVIAPQQSWVAQQSACAAGIDANDDWFALSGDEDFDVVLDIDESLVAPAAPTNDGPDNADLAAAPTAIADGDCGELNHQQAVRMAALADKLHGLAQQEQYDEEQLVHLSQVDELLERALTSMSV